MFKISNTEIFNILIYSKKESLQKDTLKNR